MKVRDLVYETVSALTSNRTRSLLTVLGVVIGISAVIAMTALIGGIKQSLVGELGLGQARLVTVSYWGAREQRTSDVEAMARDLANDYETVMPLSYGSGEVVSTKEKKNGNLQGVRAEYFDSMNMKVLQGSAFTKADDESGSQVALMDEGSVKSLFGSANSDVVGQMVRIGGSEYKVVGVLEGSSSTQYGGDSVTLYIPFNTLAQRIKGGDGVDIIYALAREDADVEAVSKRTEEWMIKHYNIADSEREDQLWVQTMKSVMQQLDTTMMSFQVLMTAVASISLVVGGIGIMNMMLTNVTERIREIGLRKALGARARDITRQFLLESVLLTLTGGVFGIVLGLGLAYALSGLAVGVIGMGGEGAPVTPVIDGSTILMVAAICTAIGVVFGYYPARRAAKLDPVESLHYQ